MPARSPSIVAPFGCRNRHFSSNLVIPAQAGIRANRFSRHPTNMPRWIPASAGMTDDSKIVQVRSRTRPPPSVPPSIGAKVDDIRLTPSARLWPGASSTRGSVVNAWHVRQSHRLATV